MDSRRDDMQSLPEGIDALRALVLAMMSERDALALEQDTLQTRMTGCVICCCSSDACISAPIRSVYRRNSCNWGWKRSSRRSPKQMRRPRSAILSCARTMPPSGEPAAARCRRTCRG